MAGIEEFYDDETWDAIEGWGRRTASAGSSGSRSGTNPVRQRGATPTAAGPTEESSPSAVAGERIRVRTAGAVMAGALFTGVGEVFEPPEAEPDEEFRPELNDTRLAPVTYLHAPGHPEESMAIVRPWLF